MRNGGDPFVLDPLQGTPVLPGEPTDGGGWIVTIPGRGGTFWWLYVSVLAGAALFIAHTFVGMLVLGVSGYYATRKISTRFERVTESKRMAAGLTVTVLVPVLVLALYAGIRILLQVQQQFDESVFSMLVSRVLGPDVEESSPAALLRNPLSLDRLTDLLSGRPSSRDYRFST